MKYVKQNELCFPEVVGWGGRRRKAGRKKRKGGVAHVSRAAVSAHDPRLVTVKRARGLPSLRTRVAGPVIVEALRKAQKGCFRICHFSIQRDHLHLIVEADDARALAAGMKGLLCRVVKGLNHVWSRRGSVFPERFHDLVLRSLRQVRNALVYVLNNHRKHGVALDVGSAPRPDLFSSGSYFDGWSDHEREYDPAEPGSHVAPGGWKLRLGWMRRYSRISLRDVPLRR